MSAISSMMDDIFQGLQVVMLQNESAVVVSDTDSGKEICSVTISSDWSVIDIKIATGEKGVLIDNGLIVVLTLEGGCIVISPRNRTFMPLYSFDTETINDTDNKQSGKLAVKYYLHSEDFFNEHADNDGIQI